jgi:hypothetical protein
VDNPRTKKKSTLHTALNHENKLIIIYWSLNIKTNIFPVEESNACSLAEGQSI